MDRPWGRPPSAPVTDHLRRLCARYYARAADEVRRLARLEQAGRGGAVVSERTVQHADGRVLTERTYAQPDWRVDAFYLERTYPDRWGKRVQADLSLHIRRIAEEVAAETGISADDILKEAQSYLKDYDQRRH
jgi:hypothetical protein